MSEPVKIQTVDRHVTEHGWLRRKELDRKGIEVWEQPDGTLFAARPGDGIPELRTLVWTNCPWWQP